MIVEGDAEGTLVKMTEDGLPVCSGGNEGVMYYLADSDELVYCAAGGYRVLGGGVCAEPSREGGLALDGGEAGASGDAAVDAEVLREVPCTLREHGSGARTLECADGTTLTLPAQGEHVGQATEDPARASDGGEAGDQAVP